jgi:hypothetical protein
MLAATARRWDEAERHFTSAFEVHTRLRSPPWCAHTQHEHARMLLARGHAGDSARARDLLANSQATAEALGMSRLSRRVRLAGLELATPRT